MNRQRTFKANDDYILPVVNGLLLASGKYYCGPN
jgi:hypothetical protein